MEILGFSIFVALNSLAKEAKTTANARAITHSLTVLNSRKFCNIKNYSIGNVTANIFYYIIILYIKKI